VLDLTLAPGARAYDGRTGSSEEEEMGVYIIAVKRERRAEVSADWTEALRDAPGVEMADEGATPEGARGERRRVTVRATEDGVEELRRRVGAFCYIEPLIVHGPSAEPDAGRASTASDEL